jgi:hypothetical protein
MNKGLPQFYITIVTGKTMSTVLFFFKLDEDNYLVVEIKKLSNVLDIIFSHCYYCY